MSNKEEPGLSIRNTSLAIKLGLPLGKFFSSIGSKINGWLAKGFVNLKNLAKNMIDGAKELGSAILRGDWNIFKNWLKEDPIALAAGAGVVILAGATVVGVVGAIGSGIAGIVGSIGIGGITLAGIGGSVMMAAVSAGQTIWTFDFNKSDQKIYDEINSAFGGLANVAGESMGRSLAGFVVNRKETPKLKINIKATATLFLELEDNGDNEIASEILESLSGLGWAFFRFAKKALFSIGYINFRQWAKKNIKSGIPWVDKMIASWGEEGGKSWIISQKINEGIEAIGEENKALGQFLEGVVEGFGDGLTDFIQLEYR